MFFIKSGLNEELVTPPVKPRKNEHYTRKACTLMNTTLEKPVLSESQK